MTTTPIEPTHSKKYDAIVVGSGRGRHGRVRPDEGRKRPSVRDGRRPEGSVVNSFGQTHDVKNLFVVDGSIFVSAGNQNPTWTILALSMHCTTYLAEELKKDNV
jgi:hypothetical protein